MNEPTTSRPSRAMRRRIAAVAILASVLHPAAAQDRPREAETVMTNGRILIFKGVERHAGAWEPRFAQAVAIADGRFAFIGQDRKARRYVGPKTRVIDLGGRMVMPGIVDGHFHGTRLSDCEMGYAGGTVAQILARLQACLDRPGQTGLKKTNVRMTATHIFGEAILPPGTALTRDDLDRLDTTRPVMVENADGHKFWMNGRAIENARIDEKTPVPPGGQIGRDASGRPNGFFADLDVGDWGQKAPVTEDSLVDVVRRTNADANRMGITSVFVPGGGEDEIARWAKIQDEGKMTLRAKDRKSVV